MSSESSGSSDSLNSTEPYSSSRFDSDEVLTITSSSDDAATMDYETENQSDAMSSSGSSQGQSHQQAMNNEPLEGQVFEVPLVNVVQEAVVIARSQEQQQQQNNSRSRETTPMSCTPSEEQLKPVKNSSKKRKR